jgi:hypothetical protein
MSDVTVIIPARFHGPPASGNGGYSCGRLAAGTVGPVEVSLRRPPPLDVPLRVEVAADGRRGLWADRELVGEARPASLALDVPAAPSFEAATQASAAYVGFARHPFPTCFTCGPARAVGDGLRIFAGRLDAAAPAAAPWVPHDSLPTEAGAIAPEVLWAAIDCPGYFGVGAPDHPVALLGRMTAEIVGRVRPGDRCVAIGWSLGREGRKLYAGLALFGPDGALVARARQTWITIGPPVAGGGYGPSA